MKVRYAIPDGDEDFDNDGLTNIEEQKVGTSFSKVDTDLDGLTDKEEVAGCLLKEKTLLCSNVVFVPTNPLLEDTDNDGIKDKDEALGTKFDPSTAPNVNVPVNQIETIGNTKVNMSAVIIALIIGVPLGYLLLKGIRRKSNIELVE